MSSARPSSLGKLAERCLAFLVERPGTERALVITQEGEQVPVIRRIHGGLDPLRLAAGETPEGMALQLAREGQRSVHSVDVTQDPVFEKCPGRAQLRSVLCVPVAGARAPVGYLYADHTSRAGALSHSDLRAVETFATLVGPELEVALAAARSAPPTPGLDGARALRAAAVVLGLGVVWAGVGLAGSMRSRPPAPPAAIQIAEPQVVIASYLGQLKMKQFQGAYQLLSRRQQVRVAQKLFDKEAAAWMAQPQNAWDLDYRRAAAGQVTGSTAEVVVQPAPGMQTWTYRLVQESPGGPWRLDSWTGGPLAEANPGRAVTATERSNEL